MKKIETRVKPKIYGEMPGKINFWVEELENYPPELPGIIEEGQSRIRECPSCGRQSAELMYAFRPDAYGGAQPSHDFWVRCNCGIQTVTFQSISDDPIDLKRCMEDVLVRWNKRPGDKIPISESYS